MPLPIRTRALRALALGAVLVLAGTAAPALADAGRAQISGTTTPELIGQVTLPSGAVFQGTAFGGLSGVTYDAKRGVYYAISDDRGDLNPARFYTLRIAVSDGPLQAGVKVLDVTTLLDRAGHPFPASTTDTEGIALTSRDTLVITSEGDASKGIDPFVREFSLRGQQVASFAVPAYYNPAPDGTKGNRNNLSLESSGVTPYGRYLFSATENALVQDGPQAALGTPSPSRILRYDAHNRALGAEFVYVVEPVKDAPIPPDSFATNGLVDLLPLGPTRLLALERGFSTGVGNSVRLFLVDVSGATNVRGRAALPADLAGIQVARKTLLLDLNTLGITLDNLEGLTFGPPLPDGRRSVIVVSDNNFSTAQRSQFLLFAL